MEFNDIFTKFIIPNQTAIFINKPLNIDYNPKFYTQNGVLLLDYEKAEDKETWLKENGYTGLENLDVDESWKCYGHTCGRTTMIDHKNKKVIVGGYPTDD